MVGLMKETEFFTLHSLCDGIYAAVAKPGQGARSNAGIVDLGEELLVFDSLSTPSAGKELRRQAEGLTGKKVKYLINSHYHGDHVFGNQEFIDTTIISTSKTYALCIEKNKLESIEIEEKAMQQYLLNLNYQIETTEDAIARESLINQYDEFSKVLADLPQMKIVLPSVLFEEKLIIEGSNRKVELRCLGGGHTPCDAFMYVPSERIAFMGDLVTEKLHVPIYNPSEFLAILKTVKKMNIDTVVPGHGDVSDIALIQSVIDYLTVLTRKSKDAHQRGLSLEDFITGFETPSEYIDWKGINGIKTNLTNLYNFYSN